MTQQDRFFIPKNIQRIIDHAEVLQIVNVDTKHSLQNKPTDFLRWFGFLQTFRMGIRVIARTIQGKLDQWAGYKLYHGLCGIEHVARKNNVPYKVIHDSNSNAFVDECSALAPDLILSFSAPEVIREPLLSIPKHGILNVHGSLLPDYRGCMPSFWYLYHEEEYAGATVHLMSKKIDDGDIVAQDKVYIGDCQTMFELMKRTKELGGQLMVDVLHQIEIGKLTKTPNMIEKGRYFTWPTKEQSVQFREKKKKLV